MRIETESVRNGAHNGDTVWICHYMRPDIGNKPLRCVPPTKAIIMSNDELPENKRVYYSKSHFRPISKSGKVLAKIISPVDNTGYRSRAGNELHVFTDEAECEAAWNEQLQECIQRLQDEIDVVADRLRGECMDLERMQA